MSKVVHVDDSNFKSEVLDSAEPVLVDFWAEWCGPCRMIAPVVEELANEYAGRVKVAKLNTESSYQIPAQYGVRGIPTLMIFKDGKAVGQMVGAAPKQTLSGFINKFTVTN